MFVDVIAIPCRPDALSVAERLALSKLAVKLRRLGPEIFESPADIGIAADVLAESIRIAEQLTEPTDLGPADFAAIAAESGIIASMVIDSARQDIEAAISLAMRAPEMSEKEFLWNFDELPPFAAHLVPGMVERNAVLIGLGKPYDERKPALQAFAAVWVAQHAARLEHPA
jgi:hypothetical protein